MDEAQKLGEALWGLFREEIRTGEPVFFCFSQETLSDGLPLRTKWGSAIGFGLRGSPNFFDVDGDTVSLRPTALAVGWNGLTMAIVLVCQQVLAVEEMVREASRYSENAYFPRLRSIMAPELPELSVNPFAFDEFEAIWRRFAKEIRSIPGSTDDSITFQFGAYSGVNKARAFPLSQALLSRADLAEIVQQCRLERLRKGSTTDVWGEIRRERNHLSRRGQRLVNSGFLRERIVEQVHRYALRISPSLALTQPGSTTLGANQLELGVSLDITDWVHEEYTAFLTPKGTSRRIEDDRAVSVRLSALLAKRGYVLLALGEFGDYWTYREGEVDVNPGEILLIVGTSHGIRVAQAALDGLSEPISLDESRVKPLGSAAALQVCPALLHIGRKCLLTLRAGHITRSDPGELSQTKYQWVGGICLDARSRKYLREALPHGVRFGHQEFRTAELNRVGDFTMTWEAFERAIRAIDTDATYDLQFPNGQLARLSVGVKRQSVAERMGFAFDVTAFCLRHWSALVSRTMPLLVFLDRRIDRLGLQARAQLPSLCKICPVGKVGP